MEDHHILVFDPFAVDDIVVAVVDLDKDGYDDEDDGGFDDEDEVGEVGEDGEGEEDDGGDVVGDDRDDVVDGDRMMDLLDVVVYGFHYFDCYP